MCSALEAPSLRSALGRGFKLVTAGSRPAGEDKDDQARTITPEAAIANGAEETPGYDLIGAAVKAGSRIAIWLSTRF